MPWRCPTAVSYTHLDVYKRQAITRANNGKAHPAGDFTITAVPADKIFKTSLTGEELLGENFGIKAGVQKFTDAADIKDGIFGGLKPSSTSTEPKFTASGKVSYEMTLQAATDTEPAAWIIKATVESDDGSKRYFTGKVSENSTSANSVWPVSYTHLDVYKRQYKKGTNPELDDALERIDRIYGFLQQKTDESFSLDESVIQMIQATD